MRPSFQPRLVNPPFGDPSLYIPFSYRGKAILFDAGDLAPLSNRDLLKVDHIFITHTHMDHFSGFDRILRLCLGRNKILHLYGPDNFLYNLEGKLNSYQWNLVDNFTYQLVIKATEFTGNQRTTRIYRCQDGFAATGEEMNAPLSDILLETPSISVTAAILDHQIPCLGLALKERFHINIIKPALTELGLIPGPWLKRFKKYLFLERPPDTVFEVSAQYTQPSSRPFSLGELADRIVRITAGQKIAYITDVGFTSENIARIKTLAEGVDHLFIEAAFLDEDRGIASEKYHLTARQAGYLAAVCGVERLTVFHFSPRYTDRYDSIYKEANTAFCHYRLSDNVSGPPAAD